MALQGQVCAQASSTGGADGVGPELHSKPRGRRSLGKGRGMASAVQCAGAGPGPPAPRVSAAGPDDVAWCRPLR